MFFVRQGATHKFLIGPVVAVANGYVPVTTLDLSTADEKAAILHDNGTVVSISAYTFAAITSADGYYHLTLQSGITNTVGHVTIVINDDSLCLPVKAEYTVIDTVAYDALFADGATGAFTGVALAADQAVNAAKIGGQTVTAGAGITMLASVGTAATSTAQTGDAFARLGAPAGASVSADVAAVKAETASILTDTAEIGAAGAGLTALASAANLSTVAGYLDTEVAAILAAVDTEVGAIKTKTDYLPSATAGSAGGVFIAGSNAATTAATLTVTGALSINGTNTVAQTGDSYPFGNRTVCRGTVSGTAPSSTGFTASAMSPSGAVADQFKGRILIFDIATTTAALRGQATNITANTSAALPVFTFTALTTAPVSGDTFSIV